MVRTTAPAVLRPIIDHECDGKDPLPATETQPPEPVITKVRSGSVLAFAATFAAVTIPTPVMAFDPDASTSLLLAGSSTIGNAALAWFHYLGIIGIGSGLTAERFLLQYDMPLEVEKKANFADLIYGLSAFSMLASGTLRAMNEKGLDFYAHEPLFWLKMVSVAVLGGLSLFPAIVFFRRDMARKQDPDNVYFAPLSAAMVDRLTTIINAELLAILTIPLLASLMARGVLYWGDFPLPLGVALYLVSLGGAGLKYGKEALDMMDAEGALDPISKEEYDMTLTAAKTKT